MIFLRNLTVVHTLLSLLKFFRHTVRVYRTFNYKEAGSLRLFGCLIKCCLVSQPAREERKERGQLRFFLNLGRTVRADILDQIFLGSQKTSQMAAYVPKSKNVESSLNFNNLFSNKYPITGSSCLMWISLLRISLLRFFKTITKIWLMRLYGLFILLLRT